MKPLELERKKPILAGSLMFIAGLICILLVQLILNKQIISPLSDTNNSGGILAVTTKQIFSSPSPDSSKLNILLLGYGGLGLDGGFLTDAIQVLHIDFEKNKMILISVPRDLWVTLPNGQESKINAVLVSSAAKAEKDQFITTGAHGVKKLIGDILGLPIDYFIGVDFVGFQRAIGIQLQGIDVDVEETLDDPWYPISGEELNTCGLSDKEIADLTTKYSGFELEQQFKCRYEHLHFNKGILKMQGGDALKYVRSRHGSTDGDISRGKRQQQVLSGIKKKLFSLEALDNIPNFYEAFSKHVQTDIRLEILKNLAPALKKYGDYSIIFINLSPTNVLANSRSSNGQSILLPKEGDNRWEKVQQFIFNQLN